jgi:hypothetical protein
MSVLSAITELAQVGLDQKTLNRAVADSVEVKEAVIRKAAEVQARWQQMAAPLSDAPVHDIDGIEHQPGQYKQSIHVRYERDKDGQLIAFVETNDMPLAKWLEFGSIHNKEQAFVPRLRSEFGSDVE